jgi:hypothetical protein
MRRHYCNDVSIVIECMMFRINHPKVNERNERRAIEQNHRQVIRVMPTIE